MILEFQEQIEALKIGRWYWVQGGNGRLERNKLIGFSGDHVVMKSEIGISAYVYPEDMIVGIAVSPVFECVRFCVGIVLACGVFLAASIYLSLCLWI